MAAPLQQIPQLNPLLSVRPLTSLPDRLSCPSRNWLRDLVSSAQKCFIKMFFSLNETLMCSVQFLWYLEGGLLVIKWMKKMIWFVLQLYLSIQRFTFKGLYWFSGIKVWFENRIGTIFRGASPAHLEQPRVLCCCDFACCAPHFFLDAIPAAAANCILTDYQHEAVNQQLRELRGDRVGGGFQQMDMEKIMKWEHTQRKGGRN